MALAAPCAASTGQTSAFATPRAVLASAKGAIMYRSTLHECLRARPQLGLAGSHHETMRKRAAGICALHAAAGRFPNMTINR